MQPALGAPVTQGNGSLFVGQGGLSLFAPLADRQPALGPALGAALGPRLSGLNLSGKESNVERIRHLIALAEAGSKGYDAVQYGAKIRPSKPPTAMTIAEIYDWIDATPGQPHAIGRYQFIPKTLRALVKRLAVDPKTQFSPAVQDLLADSLLADAGLHALHEGEIGRHKFMKNLAKIWAGLPTSTGLSYYHGHAGNKATMTWAFFEAEMAKIFPG
jgi:muramidase (phage lysozyme)